MGAIYYLWVISSARLQFTSKVREKQVPGSESKVFRIYYLGRRS